MTAIRKNADIKKNADIETVAFSHRWFQKHYLRRYSKENLKNKKWLVQSYLKLLKDIKTNFLILESFYHFVTIFLCRTKI